MKFIYLLPLLLLLAFPAMSESLSLEEMLGAQEAHSFDVPAPIPEQEHSEAREAFIDSYLALAKSLYDNMMTCHRLSNSSEIGFATKEQELASRILAYVQTHYAEEVTNGSIGTAFGYHPNYVSFLVKRATGMPVHQYLIHTRLVSAANLLENTTKSVNEVAIACGFYDQAYFCKYFKKHFGIAPSKYRGV